MNSYTPVILPVCGERIAVHVPASKSITNRALLLAALSRGEILLTGGELSADTRAFLQCLLDLGIQAEQRSNGILVHGCGGNIPKKNATVNVQSAGTAARFLTVALAFCGGEYTLLSSAQMQKRPMEEIISILREAGVTITCLQEEGHFPFTLRSDGISKSRFTVNTDKSSQYASALLLTAGCRKTPLTLSLTGNRTKGSYIEITLKMLADFGISYERIDEQITVFPSEFHPKQYAIEPDLSGACYFYALALLLRRKVLVYGVRQNSMQGDKKFLELLQSRGVTFIETVEGLEADGTNVESFIGFDENLQDFSDQTLTVAALAPFATTPSTLKNVGHIRLQECDRINAIVQNLTNVGVNARSDASNIYITPSSITGGNVQTFDDHRVAMAFTLVGLKTGNITIENPECCKKTFENYFEIISQLK